MKGDSSRYMRREFPEREQHYWQAKRQWSGTYRDDPASGAHISVPRQYIQNQQRPGGGSPPVRRPEHSRLNGTDAPIGSVHSYMLLDIGIEV